MESVKVETQELIHKIQHCQLCRLHKTRKYAVPPEGDPHADIMFIAQAPGREENERGSMFVGPSGKVLNRLLEQIHLRRNAVYMTNMLKCFLPRCRKPRQDEIDACDVYLEQEINLVNPRILVPLGYHPIKHLFRKFNLDTPNRNGFPLLFGKLRPTANYKILPLRHPAAVVHESASFEKLASNYHKIRVISNTCRWYKVCPVKRFYDQGKIPKNWIDHYCKGDWEKCRRFQLEEQNIYHPDQMMPDGSIDHNLD